MQSSPDSAVGVGLLRAKEQEVEKMSQEMADGGDKDQPDGGDGLDLPAGWGERLAGRALTGQQPGPRQTERLGEQLAKYQLVTREAGLVQHISSL